MTPLDPAEECPLSGLTNAACVAAGLCDCYPDGPDRFALDDPED
jgi:hypothetical protein